MSRCRICGKTITAAQKIVRIVVEAARRDRRDDRRDPSNWSVIEDWDVAALMHLGCVKRLRAVGDPDLPYGAEVDLLLLDEIELAPVVAAIPGMALPRPLAFARGRSGGAMLRVIEGGKRC